MSEPEKIEPSETGGTTPASPGPIMAPEPVVETPTAPATAEAMAGKPPEQPAAPAPASPPADSAVYGVNCPDCGAQLPATRGGVWSHMMGKHGPLRGKVVMAEFEKRGLIPTREESKRASRQQKPKIDLGQTRATRIPVESPGGPPPDFTDIDTGAPLPAANGESGLKLPNYHATAEMSFDMFTGILSQIFGPEWQPRNVEERAIVVRATEEYYKSIELPDIPPGYVLCFVCLAYAAPRFQAPTTKTKLAMAWYWVKSKFTRRKPLIQIVKQTPPPLQQDKP